MGFQKEIKNSFNKTDDRMIMYVFFWTIFTTEQKKINLFRKIIKNEKYFNFMLIIYEYLHMRIFLLKKQIWQFENKINK